MFEVFVQQYGAGTFSKSQPLHIVGGDDVTLCGRMVYRRQYSAMDYDAARARYPEVKAKRICAYCQQKQDIIDGKPQAKEREQAIWRERVDAWNKAMRGTEETR